MFGDLNTLETVIFDRQLSKFDFEKYRDQRVVVKGCGETHIPESAYVDITVKLSSIAKSIMYGEPCSTVPIFKQKNPDLAWSLQFNSQRINSDLIC